MKAMLVAFLAGTLVVCGILYADNRSLARTNVDLRGQIESYHGEMAKLAERHNQEVGELRRPLFEWEHQAGWYYGQFALREAKLTGNESQEQRDEIVRKFGLNPYDLIMVMSKSCKAGVLH